MSSAIPSSASASTSPTAIPSPYTTTTTSAPGPAASRAKRAAATVPVAAQVGTSDTCSPTNGPSSPSTGSPMAIQSTLPST